MKKFFIQLGVALLFFVLLFVVMLFFASLIESVRMVLSAFFILFFPGWCLVWIIFPKKGLDIVERLIMAFAFSFIVFPLPLFYLNKAGVAFTEQLVFGVTVVINILLLVFVFVRLLVKKKKS